MRKEEKVGKTDQLFKKAMEYANRRWEDIYIREASEYGGSIFVSTTDGYKGTEYGKPYLMINKETGEISTALMSDMDIGEMIMNATEIDIPEEYREK